MTDRDRADAGKGHDGEDRVVTCPVSMEIMDAADLRRSLSDVLADGRPVVLDAGEVERVDTASLQVFAAFVRDARARGIRVEWRAPSDAMREAVQLLALDDHLGLGA